MRVVDSKHVVQLQDDEKKFYEVVNFLFKTKFKNIPNTENWTAMPVSIYPITETYMCIDGLLTYNDRVPFDLFTLFIRTDLFDINTLEKAIVTSELRKDNSLVCQYTTKNNVIFMYINVLNGNNLDEKCLNAI